MGLIDLGDCDWFALDSSGQIGCFTSAGSEFVPEYYWSRIELLREVADKMKAMPAICGHKFIGDRHPGSCYETWTDAANRGL